MGEVSQNSARVDDSFEGQLEAISAKGAVRECEVVQGTVTSVGAEFVVVSLGEGSEGQVPVKEFRSVDGAPQVKAGDKIDVFVEFRENETGPIRLSKKKAEALKTWDNIRV